MFHSKVLEKLHNAFVGLIVIAIECELVRITLNNKCLILKNYIAFYGL